MSNANPTGWVHDTDAIAETSAWLIASSLPATYAQATASGDADPRGGRLFCADFESEPVVFGHHLPPWAQTIGACVGYGTGRAAQGLIVDHIARFGGEVFRAQVSPGAIYAGSRVNIGRGRLGYRDGSVVAWSARWVTQTLLLQMAYPGVDLSSDPRDGLAEQWGRPGHGVPPELADCGRYLRIAYTTQIDSADSLCAALWRRQWVSGGCNTIWSDTRDANGQCRPARRGGHCENRCGIYLDQDGDVAILHRQSWGSGIPDGPQEIRLQDGTRKRIPAGVYGVKLRDEVAALQESGDFWAFSGARGWTPERADWRSAL